MGDTDKRQQAGEAQSAGTQTGASGSTGAQNPTSDGETPKWQGQGQGGAGQPNAAAQGNSGGDQQPANFDKWLEGQEEGTRSLVSGHIAGLKSALESERSERKQLAKQLRDLSAKAEEGSELRGQLDTLTRDFEAVNRRAAFYEAAPADLTNVRLAYLAAQDAGAIAQDGKVDWAKLREQAPELFRRQPAPQGNAGSGAKQTGTHDRSMNTFIRTALGKSSG